MSYQSHMSHTLDSAAVRATFPFLRILTENLKPSQV